MSAYPRPLHPRAARTTQPANSNRFHKALIDAGLAKAEAESIASGDDANNGGADEGGAKHEWHGI